MKKLYLPLLVILLFCLSLPAPRMSAASPQLSETNLLAVSGDTLLAYFNTGSHHLSRSEDNGFTWRSKNIGSGLNGSSLVALEMSPGYDTDQTVFAATSASILMSTNKGDNFTSILQLPDYGLEGSITSLAIGPGGRILIGTSTGSLGGGVGLYDNETWTNLEIGQKDVFAAAFSPNYLDDAQIVAFTYDGTLAQLETRVNSAVWNDFFPAAQLYSESGVVHQSAVIEFPGYYYYTEGNAIFVGLNATGNSPDVYRVHFTPSYVTPAAPTVTDLNINGPDTSCNVHSIAINGSVGGGSLAAGLADSNIVKRASNLWTNPITWLDSSIPPEGSANVDLEYAHPVDGPYFQTLFAITTGIDAGKFVSEDDGDTFKPIPPLQVLDLAVADSTMNTISLTWTSPLDADNYSVYYDLRYLEGIEITEENWNSAIRVAGVPAPQPAGSIEAFTVGSLKPDTTYFFALETSEIEMERSALSNSPSGQTRPVSDIDPPLPVTDLRTTRSTTNSITLAWTAPGDPFEQHYEEGGIYPPDGAINIPPQIVFRWHWEEGADAYSFQLSDNITFNNLIDNQTGIPGTSWEEPLTLNYGTSYYWRVLAEYYPEVPGGLEEGPQWTTRAFVVMAEPTAHTEYDIRYSTTTINVETWLSASQSSNEPAPKNPGENETFIVRGLKSNTTYYFALKTKDSALNWSEISNICSGKTDKGGYIRILDVTPPGKITDLKAIDNQTDSITLQWTAPGDDGYVGTASYYDLRYLENIPINDDNWDSTKSVAGEPSPQPSGSKETFTVKGLNPDTVYYFGIKTADEVPNISKLSNIAEGKTRAIPPPPTPPPTPKPTPTPTPTPATTTIPKSPDDGSDITRGDPIFDVIDIKVSKDKIAPGEKIEALATIANIGNATGDFTAQLIVNGKVQDSKNVVSIAPASQKTAVFVFSNDTAGEFTLQVGYKTAAVSVIEAAKKSSGIPWWIILIALVVLVVIILILRKVLHWGFKK